MSEYSFIKRRWKLLLNIVTVIALLVLVVAIRDQLVETLKNLREVNAWVLLLLIPIQMLNYHSQTEMYRGMFAVVGNKLRYWSLYKVALELNFINHVFPSGGVSGISYFGVRMRSSGITAGKATLIQLMKLVLLILSFEILLVSGLLFLAIGNKANDFVILVTSSITTLMLIGTFAFVMIIGSEKRISATFTFLTKAINKVLHFFMPKSPETISIARVQRVFEELHVNYKLIESRWKDLKWPFVWGLMANATEVAAIYAVYIAFGEWVNIGAVILAYAVANVAGLISVMPGGVGIYEALMTGVLVAAGVPAAISLPVTVMYRMLSTMIQIPPGYFFYHRMLRRPDPDVTEAASGK
ncbi:MAG TPA: lysylphosphatidylglycerol synthase transmembrane domain-containing protein [Candidatus Saccharimonadales bacterium]|nr:lysylphosphatidylglycerol synthase transmembrane domain-containing protein [Candidatus Saccharimonadales bacterium]